jgi:hypothetical protein
MIVDLGWSIPPITFLRPTLPQTLGLWGLGDPLSCAQDAFPSSPRPLGWSSRVFEPPVMQPRQKYRKAIFCHLPSWRGSRPCRLTMHNCFFWPESTRNHTWSRYGTHGTAPELINLWSIPDHQMENQAVLLGKTAEVPQIVPLSWGPNITKLCP